MRHGGRSTRIARSVAVMVAAMATLDACSPGGSRHGTTKSVDHTTGVAAHGSTRPSAVVRTPGSDAPHDAVAPTTTSTTRTPVTTTTSTTVPPQGGSLIGPLPRASLHGSPRPTLVNTGTDFIAVFTSLMYQLQWLDENPDPSKLVELLDPTGPWYPGYRRDNQSLIDLGVRCQHDGYQLVSARVTSASPWSVTLRVVEDDAKTFWLDARGREVDAPTLGSRHTRIYAMSGNADRGWRIHDVMDGDPVGVIQP